MLDDRGPLDEDVPAVVKIRALSFKVGPGGEETNSALSDAATDQVFRRSISNANRQVDLMLFHIGHGVADAHLNVNAGMVLDEVGHETTAEIADHFGAGDAQEATEFRVATRQTHLELAKFVLDLRSKLGRFLPGWRELEPSWMSLEESGAQGLLQRAQTTGNGGGIHAEKGRCPTDPLAFNDGQKEAEIIPGYLLRECNGARRYWLVRSHECNSIRRLLRANKEKM